MGVIKGDIYYVEDRDKLPGYSERRGRPALVVSSGETAGPSGGLDARVVVVFLTATPRYSADSHVVLDSVLPGSTALCEWPSTIKVERLGDFCGTVTPTEKARVDEALRLVLGMLPPPRDEGGRGEQAHDVNVNELTKKCAAAEGKCALLKEMYEDLLSRYKDR